MEVSLAGISDLGADYAMGRPRPTFHAVVLTLAGQGHAVAGGQRFRLRPGHLLVLPRGTAHSYRSSRSGWSILWWHLRPFGRWEHLSNQGVQYRPAREQRMLTEAFEGVLRESNTDPQDISTFTEHAGYHYAQLAAIAIRREVGQVDLSAEDDMRHRFRKLWNEVDGLLHEDWPLERLARSAHCSVGHLHRRVREVAGCTPAQMVLNLRIRRAQALLAESALPVYQIAEAVGFRNPYAFSAAFRRETGESPSEFRRRKC